jgi:hypothetical protein
MAAFRNIASTLLFDRIHGATEWPVRGCTILLIVFILVRQAQAWSIL